ncbi:MAG: metallophosphoesterase [Pseudomonadales bacterium]
MTTTRHIGHLERIGLIGDVHAEHELLAQALDFLSDAARTGGPLDAILCTGDIADGSGCVDQACDLLREYRVHTVAGNHDRWLLNDQVRHVEDAHQLDDIGNSSREFLNGLPQTLTFDSPMGPGMLCHGIGNKDLAKVWPGTERLEPERNAALDAMIAEERYRLVLNGHMHFRCVIHFEGLALLNAGTLKPRHKPGFSIVDFHTGAVSAHEFDGAECPAAMQRSLLPAPHDRVWANTQAFDGQWQPTTLYAQ